jgi:RNA polymerase sigma factor (sigma-70 family)
MFEKYKRNIVAEVRSRYISDPAVTWDDVIQDIQIALYLKGDKFNPKRGSERTFVMTIVKRIIIDTWRKGRRHEHYRLDIEDDYDEQE